MVFPTSMSRKLLFSMSRHRPEPTVQQVVSECITPFFPLLVVSVDGNGVNVNGVRVRKHSATRKNGFS